MTQHDTPSTPERTAALIAAIMLRFAEQDIDASATQHDGIPPYVILPDGPRLQEAELVDWLEQAPKPLFAVPIYIRRMIASWPAFTGSQLTRDLKNQTTVLAEAEQQHQLTDASTILLDSGLESVSFPLAHLKVWAANYLTSVGWTLTPPKNGTPAQMGLIVPGKRRSPGVS